MDNGTVTLRRFDRHAQEARTLPELNGLYNSFVRGFGFTAYAVGFVPGHAYTEDPFLLLDWPRVWLELYAREGFASEDAVVAAASTATEPFTWRELQEAQPGASVRIFAAARSFGWTDGLLIPVRVPAGPASLRIGVASLAAPTLDGLEGADRSIVAEGSRLALVRAVALRGSRVPASLSERERQALTLVATGRGDREIAALLNLSVPTAHFHVEQAKRKLGAITRAQAVAIAVARSLVDEP